MGVSIFNGKLVVLNRDFFSRYQALSGESLDDGYSKLGCIPMIIDGASGVEKRQRTIWTTALFFYLFSSTLLKCERWQFSGQLNLNKNIISLHCGIL